MPPSCTRRGRRGLWCLTFDMTDYKGSVTVRKYMEEAEAKPLDGAVKAGMWLRVQGIVELSRDGKDIQLRPLNITKVGHQGRKDTNPEKRVELHLHTRMSNMDALTDTESVIKQAIEWGHPGHRRHRPRRGAGLPRRVAHRQGENQNSLRHRGVLR